MAAVIVGRELVVTALRSFEESKGVVFHATFWGKSKMTVQFAALAYLIFLVTWGRTDQAVLRIVAQVLVWMTLVVTVASGVVYLIQAQRLVRRRGNP
jgi:CDP-diacylglycerol--glycerol-3-phosphate 3-phosphatidyltransferase